jgi:hypothetical protein
MGDEAFLGHFEFDGTKLKQFPLPSGRPLERARRLDQLAQELAAAEPHAVCGHTVPTRAALDDARPRCDFVSYPHAGRDADPTPVLGWAGWDYRQQALALATWLVERRDVDGWDAERLTPLLAGLVPWVRQWHPDIDPGIGASIGDYLRGFLDEALVGLGLSAANLSAWRPPAPTRGRRRRTTS